MQSGDLSIPHYSASVILMNMPPYADITFRRAFSRRIGMISRISSAPHQR